jgi:inner membrane protein
MDNLTHSLVGLAAAKAGLERLSPGATAVCLIASNLPDSDLVVLLFGDRWTFLHHHRGITHAIIGIVILGLLLPALYYLGDYLFSRLRSRAPTVKLKGLTLASLIVIATHPTLDWTNNYGIRWLLPWNNGWSYGDFVFIIDPYLWLTLGGAAFLLTSKSWLQILAWSLLALVLSYLVLFGPAQRGGLSDPRFVHIIWISTIILLLLLHRFRVVERWRNRIAITAFCCAILYLAALAYMHRLALNEARLMALVVANQNNESVAELAAMPTLANPLNWQAVFETDRATYRFDLRLRGQRDLSRLVRFEKPEPSAKPMVEEALKTRPARIFMDFARFPVARVDPNCTNQTLVQFADLRYTEPGSGRGSFALDVPVECESTSLNK